MALWARRQAVAPACAPWDEGGAVPALDPDRPLILSVEGPHGPAIHAANAAAAALGAVRGGRVTDLRGLCPALQVVPADPAGDAAALDRLMLWARRWCPWSATDGSDGLVLDTTGAAHLWGGEAAMLRDIEARLAGLGQPARLAAAPTHGAAWALARHGAAPRAICPAGAAADHLDPLPVAALRLDAEARSVLRRLGLKRVGDLARVPRAALARRFEAALATPLHRLDQALGRRPEPILAPPPPRRLREVTRLPEPVLDPQPWLPDLLARLCAALEAAGQGARAIRLELYRVDGAAHLAQAATARASRDPHHLSRLLSREFEALDAGFGFDLIAAEAVRVEPLSPAQAGLSDAGDPEVALAALVDRLSARMGRRAVEVPDPGESHLPERADCWAPALARPDLLAPGGLGGGGLVAPPRAERPPRLLSPPERIEVLYGVPEGPPVRFKWRHRPYRIRRHEGPERIAPEWWRARPGTRLRDYYKVEVEDGARYWLYREGLAGDGRGGEPDWFLHGLFP